MCGNDLAAGSLSSTHVQQHGTVLESDAAPDEKGPRLPDMGTVLASQNICGMHVSYHALNKNNTMNKGYNYAITPSLRALTSPSLLQPG